MPAGFLFLLWVAPFSKGVRGSEEEDGRGAAEIEELLSNIVMVAVHYMCGVGDGV